VKVRLRTKLGFAAVAVVLGVASYLLFTGPRMLVQPHVRTFRATMLPTPEGSVPVANPLVALPTAEAAKSLNNPLPGTPENRARGRVYYGYYCAFCHGPTGRGDGPVGTSYVPVPADLASEKVRGYSDGQLLRAMFTGTGHEPMLERIVPAEYRWYLVLHARQLGATARTAGR
jgi:hypothetical protein